jgi:spore coat protein U-like protein
MKKELNKTKSVFVKKSKMSLAKSTTALTCLVGLLIVASDPAAAASTSGTFIASTSVASACTISAGAMGFTAYTGSATLTQTSVVTVDCSTGASYTISFNDTADGNGKYILQNTTTGTVATGHQLLASFTNGSTAMTSGAATITGTGAGTSAAAGTITGTILSGQTGKSAGTYSKTMTLNLVY